MSMALPQVANAAPDGTADACFVHPATGTAPGVLIWPDIFRLRPIFRQLGKRLAESGHAVVVVNPFYRTRKSPPADKGSATPIQEVMPLAQSLNETTHMTDARAFRAEAASDRVGAANSPHPPAAKTKANFLIAIAENDDKRAKTIRESPQLPISPCPNSP